MMRSPQDGLHRRIRLTPGPVADIGHPVADGQGTSLSLVPRQNQPILRASATSAGSALVSKLVASGVIRDLDFGTAIGTHLGLPQRISGSFSTSLANHRDRNGRP